MFDRALRREAELDRRGSRPARPSRWRSPRPPRARRGRRPSHDARQPSLKLSASTSRAGPVSASRTPSREEPSPSPGSTHASPAGRRHLARQRRRAQPHQVRQQRLARARSRPGARPGCRSRAPHCTRRQRVRGVEVLDPAGRAQRVCAAAAAHGQVAAAAAHARRARGIATRGTPRPSTSATPDGLARARRRPRAGRRAPRAAAAAGRRRRRRPRAPGRTRRRHAPDAARQPRGRRRLAQPQRLDRRALPASATRATHRTRRRRGRPTPSSGSPSNALDARTPGRPS